MAQLPEVSQSGWGMDWGETWGGALDSFDFYALCRRMLWKHLEGLPNITKLCDLLAELSSETDQQIIDQIRLVGIDNAANEELDEWGKMAVLPRLGATDDLYRRGIKAKARATRCQAAPPDFYDIVDVVTPNGSIILLEQYEQVPQCIRVLFFDMTPEEQRIVGSLMGLCRGLGICALGVFVDSEVFEWGSTEGTVTVEHHWGSTQAGSVDPDDSAGFAQIVPL